MTEMDSPRDKLRAQLLRVLRALRRVGDDAARRTALYREAAGLIFDLREHFKTGSGDPDWRGATPAYREYVRSAYAETGWARDAATTAQTAIRHHISRLARERLAPDQLEDLGLRADNFAERKRDSRAATSAKLSTLGETDPQLDAARALAAALVMVERVTAEQARELRGRGREQARAVLARLIARAEALHAEVTE
ncbi:hypothetical protein [Micromonospora okii]|uniref:hypothetical protein n=1 Tax=Micromonospora okii TaxID=1182970 RepID=UPI001E5220FF|nr:hypothetical protein [Micromonospora okii]